MARVGVSQQRLVAGVEAGGPSFSACGYIRTASTVVFKVWSPDPASASPGNVLERHILQQHPRPEALLSGAQQPVFQEFPSVTLMLKCLRITHQLGLRAALQTLVCISPRL